MDSSKQCTLLSFSQEVGVFSDSKCPKCFGKLCCSTPYSAPLHVSTSPWEEISSFLVVGVSMGQGSSITELLGSGNPGCQQFLDVSVSLPVSVLSFHPSLQVPSAADSQDCKVLRMWVKTAMASPTSTSTPIFLGCKSSPSVCQLSPEYVQLAILTSKISLIPFVSSSHKKLVLPSEVPPTHVTTQNVPFFHSSKKKWGSLLSLREKSEQLSRWEGRVAQGGGVSHYLKGLFHTWIITVQVTAW